MELHSGGQSGIKRAIGWLALACVAMVAILNGKPSFSNASIAPRGIGDNVIALQVARNVKEVDSILGEAPSPDREAMRLKQYADFGFIACYVALYIALAMLFFPGARLISATAAASGIAAGVFDVRENLAILRVVDVPLNETTQAMVEAMRMAGLTKWMLAFFTTALFALLLIQDRKKIWRAIGAVDLIAAALGFYGLYDNAFLVWASMALGVGLVLMVAAFWRVGAMRFLTRPAGPR